MVFRLRFAPASVLLAALLLSSVGCGGGGGPGGPGGGGMIPGGGKLNWLDDGARRDAVFAAAALARGGGTQDVMQITGSTSGGSAAVSFGVVVPFPIAAATVLCGGTGGTGQPPFASITYMPGAEPVFTSCSVTISTIVLTGTTHVTGTFEAVFPKTGGGTKTISDGNFDLPMAVNSI